MNHTNKNKFLFYIGILVILLLVFLRFGLYFLKSDGFSGLSMLLPILLLCFILFALCTSAFFAAWVYQIANQRREK
ncbi:MAG: zinc ribbon domain-containing protein, partial [Lachnospiraceae bacterium]|nr:zinc ribbon domain-containing protein [Lachnospiraceae bacterium]